MADTPEDLVSVVIVNYNSGSYLVQAVENALRQSGVHTEIVVVDNASSDASLAGLKPFSDQITLIRNDRNLGFARACNIGYQNTRGGHVLFLNPDARLHEDAAAQMLAVMAKDDNAGVCGPLLLGEDGEEQAGGRRDIPSPWNVFCVLMGLDKVMPNHPRFRDFNHAGTALPDEPVPVQSVSGACMLVSRSSLESVGLFDETYFLHFEDLELCMRMGRAGKTVWFAPHAVCVHVKGQCSTARPFFVAYHKHVSFVKFINKSFLSYYPKSFLFLLSCLVYLHLGVDIARAVVFMKSGSGLSRLWKRLRLG